MNIQTEANTPDKDIYEQEAMLKVFTGTVHHFFGGWPAIFKGITDPRNLNLITYPLTGLLCTGVLMYMFRLGARREISNKLRGNVASQAKFGDWFEVANIPHGDTLNYCFKRLDVDEVQESVIGMVNTLIRKKVLDHWRLFGYFMIAIDGTGMLTFRERHCEHCLTKKLSNGEILYYHPVLEAKLVTANGFAFSIMTEFIENADPNADKQDCETKAFRRLAKRLKARFPRLRICLLLDGLFADGPSMQICEDNNWKYTIVLKDADLLNVHRSFKVAWACAKENHKRILIGPQSKIVQDYRWVNRIEYVDSEKRTHYPNVLECVETKPNGTGKHIWLTNFNITTSNVDTLANEGGRLRWKIENEGFNVQKNGGFNLEHPYSQNENAGQVFYYLLQVAYIIFQLMEKGSLFRKAFPKGVGSLKNIAFRLLEAWRNLRLSASGFCDLYKGRYQIRFDTS